MVLPNQLLIYGIDEEVKCYVCMFIHHQSDCVGLGMSTCLGSMRFTGKSCNGGGWSRCGERQRPTTPLEWEYACGMNDTMEGCFSK